MKGLLRIFIWLLLTTATYSQTNYYVDSTDGNDANDGLSPATAWQNIGRLDTTTVLNYGDSVLLQRGESWTGRLNLSSTYWPNGVVIGAYGTGPKPLINGNGVGPSQPTVKVFNFQSIKISYLDLNIGSDGVYGIWSDNTDSIWVDSCKIHDNSYVSCSAFGIVFTDQPWVSITRNVIYNMGTEAIYGGVGGSEDGPSIVSHNYCYNIGNCGANADVMHFNNVNPSIHVHHNFLDMRNPNVTTGKGCLVFTQDTGVVYNVRVYDNIMLADSGASFGFSFGRALSAPGSKGKVAYNNYVRSEYYGNSVVTGVWDTCHHNMFIGFSHVFDLRISDTSTAYHMYNNYLKPNPGPPVGYIVLIDPVVDSNTWFFKNNIVDFEDRFNLNGKYYEKDYNIYFDPSGSEVNSIYNNTQAFWDTLFIDTFDINPNSLAVDAGINVGLSFDYKGNPVPYNSVTDIGVNEYTPSGVDCDTITTLYTPTIIPDTNLLSLGGVDIAITDGYPPYTYLWSPDGETTEDISNKLAGQYTLVITDTYGCTENDTFNIPNFNTCDTTNFVVTATVTPDTNSSSVGAIDVSVSGGLTPYTYSWSSGEATQDISNKLTGNYTDTITDANGCSVDTTFFIPNFNACDTTTLILTAVVTPDTNSSSVGAIDLSVAGGLAPYTYLWSSTETTQDISGKLAGNYSVTVTDDNSCTGDSTFTITNYIPLDTIDWAVDTVIYLWANKINDAIIRRNIITEPDLDTIILGTDNFPNWAVKINYLIKEFSNDTIIHATDDLESWRLKTNAAIIQVE